MTDDFDLQRFVDAQDSGAYADAVRELSAGRKRGHWIWFVFPQIVGLGYSPTAQHYAISGLPEAQAYLAHPVLGPRVIAAARLLTQLSGSDPVAVLGGVDAQKVRSSMTLFAAAAPDEPVFTEVLEKYYAGEHDEGTTSRL